MIPSAFISSLSEGVLPHVVGLNSSREVWLTLEKRFSSQSQAHIMQTRYRLATLKKGSRPIADYFQKAQSLAHMLAAISQPL